METPTGPLTAAEFFALRLEGGDMSAASRHTALAYTTVHRASKGVVKDVATAKALATWSRTVPAAVAAGVWIDAARALGLDAPAAHPSQPPPADAADTADTEIDAPTLARHETTRSTRTRARKGSAAA